jgi:hypothetical protein
MRCLTNNNRTRYLVQVPGIKKIINHHKQKYNFSYCFSKRFIHSTHSYFLLFGKMISNNRVYYSLLQNIIPTSTMSSGCRTIRFGRVIIPSSHYCNLRVLLSSSSMSYSSSTSLLLSDNDTNNSSRNGNDILQDNVTTCTTHPTDKKHEQLQTHIILQQQEYQKQEQDHRLSDTITATGVETVTATATTTTISSLKVPWSMEWRKIQLDNLHTKMNSNPMIDTKMIQQDDELQDTWKQMEGRVTKRRLTPIIAHNTTTITTGRRNIKKTEEDIWSEQGLYDDK